MSNIPVTHSRFNGLDWYGAFKNIMVIGVGSIGSWASHFLAKMGHSLYLFDDDSVEEVNLAGQNFSYKNIGKFKVFSLRTNLLDNHKIPSDKIYSITARINEDSDIMASSMIVATDNITSRKIAFNLWENKLKERRNERLIYIDGRLNPEHFQIFCVIYDPDDLEGFEKQRARYMETLFEEDEVADLPCSAKYTSHTSAMIGSMIASLFANFITNDVLNEDTRDVPFLTEMTLPMMLLETTP